MGLGWGVILLALGVLLSGCGGSGVHFAGPVDDAFAWPTVRGANDNRGVAAGRVEAQRLIWQRKTGGEAAGEPTVRGGYLYFPGYDRRLEVFAAATGHRVFRRRYDGPVTGALPRDTAFDFLTDQNEYRLFTYTYPPGEKRTDYRVARSQAPPRRLDDSLTLIAGLNGTLYCHADDGEIRWEVKTDGPLLTAPAVVDTTIFAASGRSVVALDTRDGELRWSHQSSGAVTAAPAVDDRVYVGTADSMIYALDRSNGGMDWFFVAGGGVFTTPAVGADRIYVAANDGLIYALDKATGKMIWTYDTGAVANLSPTLAGDLLYVATRTGRLVALGAADGSVVYDHKLRSAAVTPPVVAEGYVFVADDNRRLYCFGPNTPITAENESE
ncbi:MAG TPA: PQQ-binding-like beta-propeller repeat protein [Acidobacteriota bacterium]|nr:PQQ-binding-like beta-propeller repeat protein [Acidobacteriota bacterium]